MQASPVRAVPEVIREVFMGEFTIYDLDRGVAQCAKKLGEEAVELALASVIETRERLIEETADLIYHLLVVLKARDIKLSEVESVLGARVAQTGLQEKSSRKGS